MNRTRTISLLLSFAAVAACSDEESPTRSSLGSSAERSTRTTTDFPLQTWMKATVQPAMASGDADALAAGFDRLSALAPEGYAEWSTLAAQGAAAARGGDLEACRGVCKKCHERHRDAYRAHDRSRLLKAR